MALIDLGMITKPTDLPVFAQELSVNRSRARSLWVLIEAQFSEITRGTGSDTLHTR